MLTQDKLGNPRENGSQVVRFPGYWIFTPLRKASLVVTKQFAFVCEFSSFWGEGEGTFQGTRCSKT